MRGRCCLLPPYLGIHDDPHGVGGPVWFSEYDFDQTRPFRALKVWMMLKYFGVEGYRALIEHDIDMAVRLAGAVRAHPDLELLAHGMSIVCFRYAPEGVEPGPELDTLNRRLLRALQLGGRSFLSGTVVRGAFALRACNINPGMQEEDVDVLVAGVLRTGCEEHQVLLKIAPCCSISTRRPFQCEVLRRTMCQLTSLRLTFRLDTRDTWGTLRYELEYCRTWAAESPMR